MWADLATACTVVVSSTVHTTRSQAGFATDCTQQQASYCTTTLVLRVQQFSTHSPSLIGCIPATFSSATTQVGSCILLPSPLWLPRPAVLLPVTSLSSLVSLCEPGMGWLSGFRACDLRALTTVCSGKARKMFKARKRSALEE